MKLSALALLTLITGCSLRVGPGASSPTATDDKTVASLEIRQLLGELHDVTAIDHGRASGTFAFRTNGDVDAFTHASWALVERALHASSHEDLLRRLELEACVEYHRLQNEADEPARAACAADAELSRFAGDIGITNPSPAVRGVVLEALLPMVDPATARSARERFLATLGDDYEQFDYTVALSKSGSSTAQGYRFQPAPAWRRGVIRYGIEYARTHELATAALEQRLAAAPEFRCFSRPLAMQMPYVDGKYGAPTVALDTAPMPSTKLASDDHVDCAKVPATDAELSAAARKAGVREDGGTIVAVETVQGLDWAVIRGDDGMPTRKLLAVRAFYKAPN